jgi:hypothetical protein
MNDRFEPYWKVLTILMLVWGFALYYTCVVQPNDETRWEIIACMDEAGDLHSEAVYARCRDEVLASR